MEKDKKNYMIERSIVQKLKWKSMSALLVCVSLMSVMLFFAQCTGKMHHHTSSIGLVLSGGGAKCSAQIGAIKVLERENVDIGYISGTSFGAVVGVLYAAGYSADELEKFFISTDWLSCFASGIDLDRPVLFIKGIKTLLMGRESDRDSDPSGLFNAVVVESVLSAMLKAKGVEDFDDLEIPFACVATDFDTMKQVVFTEGNVLDAVRASMAFPGLIQPVHKSDKVLIDGGLINNLPVDVALDMGAKYIIAVDVQQGDDSRFSIPFVGYVSDCSIIAWMSERPDIDVRKRNISHANIYIHPEVQNMSALSFSREQCLQMMSIGEQAAMIRCAEFSLLKKDNN